MVSGAGTQTDTKLPQSVATTGRLPQKPSAAPDAGAAEAAYTLGPLASAMQADRDYKGDFVSRHA